MVDLKLKVEFSGGLELLFSNTRSHLVNIPSTIPEGDRGGQPVDINFLIHWLKSNLLRERAELFIEDGTLWVPYFFLRMPAINQFAMQTTRNSGIGE